MSKKATIYLSIANTIDNIFDTMNRDVILLMKQLVFVDSDGTLKNSKGESHLFIDTKCKWLLYNIYNLSYKEGTSIIDVPSIAQIKRDRASKFLEHPFDAASYLVEYYWRIKTTYKDVNKENK